MHEAIILLLDEFGEITIKETLLRKWGDGYLIQYPWRSCSEFDILGEAVDTFIQYVRDR